MHLGFIPGDRYLHARLKVNYHWHKARWHALNAPGFIPRDAHATFEYPVSGEWLQVFLLPIALEVDNRQNTTDRGSRLVSVYPTGLLALPRPCSEALRRFRFPVRLSPCSRSFEP